MCLSDESMFDLNCVQSLGKFNSSGRVVAIGGYQKARAKVCVKCTPGNQYKPYWSATPTVLKIKKTVI
jgi:hypothetical protein